MKIGVLLRFSLLLLIASFALFACSFSGEWRHSDSEHFFVNVDGIDGRVHSEGDVNLIKEKISAAGLLEEFPLRSIKAYRDLSGEFRGGGTFLGSHFAGSFGPAGNYMFFWTMGDVTYVAELPSRKIVFELEEGLAQPTVTFKFQITPESVRDKENLLSDNPNVWVNKRHISLVRVRISSDKLGEYVLIP